jgi:hypothetical protein
MCWLACVWHGATFMIDWHNFAHTLMSLSPPHIPKAELLCMTRPLINAAFFILDLKLTLPVSKTVF